MKAIYVYNTHEIVLSRIINSTILSIDGIEVDRRQGIFSRDSNTKYSGKIKSAEGNEELVEVEFSSGFPKEVTNNVKFFVNGKLVYETQVL